MSNDMHIRMARLTDAEALRSIYAPYVEKTAISFEYAPPSRQEFSRRMEGILTQYPYLVAEHEGRIVGYAYASSFKDRAAYAWAAELTVYVDETMHRRGIGKTLYAALEKVLAAQNILNAYACIAYPEEDDEYLSNTSVSFHQALGYRLIAEFSRCGYKFHRWYNVVWMEKFLGQHVAEQAPVKSIHEVRAFVLREFGIAE